MAKAKKPRTVDIARELVRPLLQDDLELWDVRFEKEGSEWYLRFFIDRPGGVTIADLERVNRALSKRLDEVDPIEHSYILEVSSPGLERRLSCDAHFERFAGSKVHVRLIRPVGGKRDWIGTLAGNGEDGVVLLLDDGERLVFPKSDAAYIKLHVDFESGGLEE